MALTVCQHRRSDWIKTENGGETEAIHGRRFSVGWMTGNWSQRAVGRRIPRRKLLQWGWWPATFGARWGSRMAGDEMGTAAAGRGSGRFAQLSLLVVRKHL